jgi:hypothetical protein
MKNIWKLFIIGLISVLTNGCEEKITDSYLVNSPIYMNREQFKSSVKITESDEISQPGKIYFKDHFIFINEVLKGIHVIDNSDPSAPLFVAFVEIPGNLDMAIKDSILYADSFTDLVALDISDINNIYEAGRVDSIFPYTLPPLEEPNELPFQNVDPEKGIVVGWETILVEEEVENTVNFRFFEDAGYYAMDAMTANSRISTGGESSMSVGVGGSMARFTINGDFLYTVDQYRLKVFDIGELTRPLLISDKQIGWNVETLFQFQKKLFFGTQTGMIIYSIADPADPVYISSYNHIRSCDPVVVEGNYAYVTLRSGNLCGEATSQLDIINVSDMLNPRWEQSYPMQEPYGLGIDGSTLFVCDGIAGLKVYNASDPKNVIKTAWFPDVNAFDVIPYDGLLMMIGTGGLYQYDYNGNNITLLSYIPIDSIDQ